MELTGPFALVLTIGTWALVLLKAYAFVDALRQPENAYPAAGKQTKTLWVVLTGASWSLMLFLNFSLIGIFSVAGTIVTLIYLLDVRPAVRGTSGGTPGPAGPYGPW